MTIERVTSGPTYKHRTEDGVAFYVTINHDEATGRVSDVFIRLNDYKRFELTMTLSRLIGIMLREDIALEVIADELMHIHSPDTRHNIPGTCETASSITARIGMVLRDYLKNLKEVRDGKTD